MKLIDLFNEILKEADDFKITRDGGGRVASKIANIGKELTPGFIRSPKEYKGIGGARLANKNVQDAANKIDFKIPRSGNEYEGGKQKIRTIYFSNRPDYKGLLYVYIGNVDTYNKIIEIFKKGNVEMNTISNYPNLFYVNFYETNTDDLYSFGKIKYYAKSKTSGVIYVPKDYNMAYLSDLEVDDIINDKNNYKKFSFPLTITYNSK